MTEFSRKPNNRKNLDELSRRAQEEFYKVGLVVEVNTIGTLVAKVDPKTGSISYGSPEIVIQGRVPGHGRGEEKEGWSLLDHEYHRAEILAAKDRGEAFHGQKGKTNL